MPAGASAVVDTPVMVEPDLSEDKGGRINDMFCTAKFEEQPEKPRDPVRLIAPRGTVGAARAVRLVAWATQIMSQSGKIGRTRNSALKGELKERQG